jgi:hypothetical protein
MSVTEEHCTPGADKVDEFVAIGVVNVGALAAFHD